MDRYIMRKDNVVVIVDCKIGKEDSERIGDFIILNDAYMSAYNHAVLYGGRVNVKYYQGSSNIYIDGVALKKVVCRSGNRFSIYDGFTFEEITAHLNQIENLGVDSFLENYKETIENTKKELAEFALQLEQDLAIKENEVQRVILNSIREVQAYIIAILFALCINMNAGLDNHAYTDAYEYIVNTYL